MGYMHPGGTKDLSRGRPTSLLIVHFTGDRVNASDQQTHKMMRVSQLEDKLHLSLLQSSSRAI